MTKDKNKIQALMKLGMTEEEALQVIADDDDIDHNKAKDFDLTPEQQKIAKKYKNVGTRKTPTKVTRTRKENPQKRKIIEYLFNALNSHPDEIENLSIDNPERIITFNSQGEHYTVTLINNRKPKGE